MLNLEKIINNTLLNQWCKNNGIDLCILFGSVVSEKTHANSDLDIAIYCENRELIDLKLKLMGELEDIFKTTIDLVILRPDMSPLLRHEILLKGKPLYISDQKLYIEQLIYTVKLYDDVPFLNKWQDLSLSVKFRKLKDVASNN